MEIKNNGRLRDAARRIGSGLLAMALSMSLAAPAGTVTAEAAGTGTLTIELYDADTGGRIPQGLAQMESRKIAAYDVTEFYRVEDICAIDPATGEHKLTEDGHHAFRHVTLFDGGHTWAGAGHNWYGTKSLPYYDGRSGDLVMQAIGSESPVDHWTKSCLEAHARKTYLKMDSVHTGDGVALVARGQLEPGRKYVILEESDPRVTAWCYEPNVYDDGADQNAAKSAFYGAEGVYGCLDWTGADKTLRLYNHVSRGGISFSVRDVETNDSSGALQTLGFPETSVFAVFNISDTAVSPDSFEDVAGVTSVGTDPKMKSSVKSGKEYGQVMVQWSERSGSKLVYRMGGPSEAYSYDEVMRAYEKYLSDSNAHAYKPDELGSVAYLAGGDSISYYNGMYGYADGTADYRPFDKLLSRGELGTSATTTGLFDMNGVVPCAMLVADGNGKVSSGAQAFPAGNYLVLQVKAPSGYYIDENFRLAVSVGKWFYNNDIDASTPIDRWGDGGVGFGNALFNHFSYTARDSGLWAQSLGKGKDPAKGFQSLDDYPAVYVPCGHDTDVTDRYGTANFDFGVDVSGGVSSSTPTAPDKQVSYNISNGALRGMGNGGNYIVNGGSVGERRYPKAGYSRVMAYIAPARAGVSLRLADKDGILALKDGSGQAYAFDGQGDAKLDGIKFRLYNDRAPGHDQNGAFAENAVGGSATGARYGANTGFRSYFGIPGSSSSVAVVNNKDANWENNSQGYKEYTAFKYGSGEYMLNIPVDDMPYGEYTLVQVGSSEGYGDASNPGWAAHIYEDLAVLQLRVVSEDKVYVRYGGKGLNEFDTPPSLIQAMIDAYTANGTTYLPQTVYRGDASIAVSTRDGDGTGISAEVAVYNISGNEVILDGRRVATAKSRYDAAVQSGTPVNMKAAADMVRNDGWEDAKVWSGTIQAGSLQTEGLKSLPHGSYMVAVTAVNGGTGDYAPVGGAVTAFQIRAGQAASTGIVLADRAAIPDVSSVLSDGTNGTKTVSVIPGASLVDRVSLSNLQAGTSYVVYGMLVDKSTGQMLPGTQVLGQKVAKASGSDAGSDAAIETRLANLITTGRALVEAGKDNPNTYTGDGFETWIVGVDAFLRDGSVTAFYKGDAYKAPLAELRSGLDFMFDSNIGHTYRDERRASSLIMNLKRLYTAFDDAADGGEDPVVTTDVALTYQNLDFSKLEGRAITAYVFVCEGGDVSSAVTGSTSWQAARSAMGTSLAAEHASSVNPSQTVLVPGMSVQAVSLSGGQKKMAATDSLRVIVSYSNLEAGQQYRATGRLTSMSDKTESDLAVAKVPEAVFTAESGGGTAELVFEGLPAKLEGARLTAYVKLDRMVSANGAVQAYTVLEKGDAKSMGWTAGSAEPGENQVDVAKSGVVTMLTDANGNKSTDLKSSRVRLRDRVEYTDLIPGEKYASVLTLHYTNGDPVLDYSGREVESVAQFTARRSSETVNIDVSYDGRNLTDKTVVSYNELRYGGADGPVVVSEKDPNSEAQSVTDAPSEARFYFQTSVKDDVTGNRYTQLGTSVAITDTVLIQGLDPDTAYKLKTEIADARSGSVLGQIPAKTSDVRSGENGTVSTEVKMSVNTTGMSGRAIVVYQSLYNQDGTELLVAHTDAADTAQTLYVPGIDTYATGADGQSKSVTPEQIEHKDVTVTANADGTLKTDTKLSYTYEAAIRDRVDYTNLAPGNTYTVKTEVVPAGGGAALGSLETKLSPMDASGSMYVDIAVDVTRYMGKSVVVYETVTDDYSGKIVLQHQDANDADQTVQVLIPGEAGGDDGTGGSGETGAPGTGTENGTTIGSNGVPLGEGPQTGVAERYGLFLGLAALFAAVAAAAGAYAVTKKRRGE